jgi:hypothetical protein
MRRTASCHPTHQAPLGSADEAGQSVQRRRRGCDAEPGGPGLPRLRNAELWFIGRLQTDTDRARVIDGLDGALGAADEDLGSTLTRLAPRWFVFRNAHTTSPPIFHAAALRDESHARADDALGDQSCAWG